MILEYQIADRDIGAVDHDQVVDVPPAPSVPGDLRVPEVRPVEDAFSPCGVCVVYDLDIFLRIIRKEIKILPVPGHDISRENVVPGPADVESAPPVSRDCVVVDFVLISVIYLQAVPLIVLYRILPDQVGIGPGHGYPVQIFPYRVPLDDGIPQVLDDMDPGVAVRVGGIVQHHASVGPGAHHDPVPLVVHNGVPLDHGSRGIREVDPVPPDGEPFPMWAALPHIVPPERVPLRVEETDPPDRVGGRHILNAGIVGIRQEHPVHGIREFQVPHGDIVTRDQGHVSGILGKGPVLLIDPEVYRLSIHRIIGPDLMTEFVLGAAIHREVVCIGSHGVVHQIEVLRMGEIDAHRIQGCRVVRDDTRITLAQVDTGAAPGDGVEGDPAVIREEGNVDGRILGIIHPVPGDGAVGGNVVNLDPAAASRDGVVADRVPLGLVIELDPDVPAVRDGVPLEEIVRTPVEEDTALLVVPDGVPGKCRMVHVSSGERRIIVFEDAVLDGTVFAVPDAECRSRRTVHESRPGDGEAGDVHGVGLHQEDLVFRDVRLEDGVIRVPGEGPDAHGPVHLHVLPVGAGVDEDGVRLPAPGSRCRLHSPRNGAIGIVRGSVPRGVVPPISVNVDGGPTSVPGAFHRSGSIGTCCRCMTARSIGSCIRSFVPFLRSVPGSVSPVQASRDRGPQHHEHDQQRWDDDPSCPVHCPFLHVFMTAPAVDETGPLPSGGSGGRGNVVFLQGRNPGDYL